MTRGDFSLKLAIVSHKPCWISQTSPSGYATDGGFPFQIQVISELFDQTTLMVPVSSTPRPSGVRALEGHNFHVCPLREPPGEDWGRKAALLLWFPLNLPYLWREIRLADAVHAPVPGDIGTIGIMVALAQNKPLFVRHCGTWGEPVTLADRFLLWLLERIKGARHAVMATGGGDAPPSSRNPEIEWIFSTTLSERELAALPVPKRWRSGQPLRLATAGRLSPNKNTATVLRSLALVKKQVPAVTLDVLGDGACLEELKRLASELNIAEAVTFHGNVSHEEVLWVLSKAHLFVFPTRVKEGFPKAVLEALACGLPVIATAVSVIPHLIGGGSGILLDRAAPTEVAEAVLQLVNDEKRLAEMSACARQTSRTYTLEKWRDKIGHRLRTRWGPFRQDGIEPPPLESPT